MMTNLVTLTKMSKLPTPLADKFGRTLSTYERDHGRSVNSGSTLVPRDDLPALVAECEGVLVAISAKDVPRALANLMGAYRKADLIDVSAYAALMSDRIARYPTDAVSAAINDLINSCKWLPSIAEFNDAVNTHVRGRQARLAVARAMEREYRRRDEEAACRAAQKREDREKLAAEELQLKEIFGDAAPLPGDLELARSAFLDTGAVWGWRETFDKALFAGQPWAAKLCRDLGAAQKVWALRDRRDQSGKLDVQQMYDALKRGEEEARRIVAEVAAGRLTRGNAQPDEIVNWANAHDRIRYMIDDAFDALSRSRRNAASSKT